MQQAEAPGKHALVSNTSFSYRRLGDTPANLVAHWHVSCYVRC